MKRLFAMLLALVLLCALCPFSALAADDTPTALRTTAIEVQEDAISVKWYYIYNDDGSFRYRIRNLGIVYGRLSADKMEGEAQPYTLLDSPLSYVVGFTVGYRVNECPAGASAGEREVYITGEEGNSGWYKAGSFDYGSVGTREWASFSFAEPARLNAVAVLRTDRAKSSAVEEICLRDVWIADIHYDLPEEEVSSYESDFTDSDNFNLNPTPDPYFVPYTPGIGSIITAAVMPAVNPADAMAAFYFPLMEAGRWIEYLPEDIPGVNFSQDLVPEIYPADFNRDGLPEYLMIARNKEKESAVCLLFRYDTELYGGSVIPLLCVECDAAAVPFWNPSLRRLALRCAGTHCIVSFEDSFSWEYSVSLDEGYRELLCDEMGDWVPEGSMDFWAISTSSVIPIWSDTRMPS